MISPTSLKKLKNEARNPKSARTIRAEQQRILHLNSNTYTPFQKSLLASLRPYIRNGDQYLDKKTVDEMRKLLGNVMRKGSMRHVLEVLRLADNIHQSALARNARDDLDRMTRRQNPRHVTARKFSKNRNRVVHEMFPEIMNLNRAGVYNKT
jgi:hypothetical protein